MENPSHPGIRTVIVDREHPLGWMPVDEQGADISKQKNEEKLSRTQELITVKVQDLKELGYDDFNDDNAQEVFEKIAEIQSRKV